MENCRAERFNEYQRRRHTDRLLIQVRDLCQPHALDPHKLKNLKAHMLDYEHALFTCLTVDGIPSDNNRAERDLRPLVIKRKKSFGSKTEQGAKALEVVLSVVWSTWRRDRATFWQYLQSLETA
jgi:transposase